jgi:predicted metal-dependent phosphoesterase TrpH
MIKADLHIHTKYSGDCDTPLEKLIERVQELGLGAIAVCDHSTAEGALKLQQMAPFKVIVAEEIASTEGEIMGMFLRETIPSGITPEEAIKAIRVQGGLVCIPHPFDHYRSSAVQRATLDRVVQDIDILEVYNSRTLPMQDRTLPYKFAQAHHLRLGAGSDAHSLAEVGRAYVEIADFDGPQAFLKVMAESRVHGNHTGPFLEAGRLARRITRRMRGRH